MERQGVAHAMTEVLERPSALGSPIPPEDKLQSHLVSIWQDVLNISPIGIDDDFYDLRGDSYAAVEIFTALEAQNGGRYPVSLLVKHSTIRELAPALARSTADDADPRIVAVREGGQKAPFFCIHAGGGEVFFFHQTLQDVARDRPVFAIRAAVESRTALPHSVEELAAQYTDAIRRLRPTGPYVIGGYCIGGAVALEVARNLSAAEGAVPPVIIIDGARPGSFRLMPWFVFHLKEVNDSDWRGAVQYLRARAGTLGQRLWWRSKTRRDPGENDGLATTNDSPGNSFTNAFVAAYGRFHPAPYAGGMFVLTSDHMVRMTGDEALGWRTVAAGDIRSMPVADTHWALFGEPQSTRLSPALDEILSALP